MTEKEKCQAGMLYDANNDLDLIKEREWCKCRCHELNNISPDNPDKRRQVLKSLLGKVGQRFEILSPFYCDYGYNIEIGESFFANHNLVILDGAKVTFGDNVFIGPSCGFHTATHPLDVERRNAGLEWAHPITVGNNVWFGANVTVLLGVTIGDNCVIGAGSVVTHDIPANVVAFGNPCRVQRSLEQPHNLDD